MFFVGGVTGHVGGAAARRLLDQGRTVRSFSRDPSKASDWKARGVDVRKGELTDARALAEALAAVEGAFLLIPPMLAPSPDYSEAKAAISAYREALHRSPPSRLVLLSSVGSEKDRGLGNITTTHLMEEALGDLPFPTAFVRPGTFLENYVPALGRAKETGWFDSFLAPTDRGFPTAATADIGQEVARLLTDVGWSGRKIVELGTDRSPDELARAMGQVVGREVQARPVPREAWPAAMEAMGLPKGRTALYEEMMEGINTGWIDFGTAGVERVESPTPPETVFASAFR